MPLVSNSVLLKAAQQDVTNRQSRCPEDLSGDPLRFGAVHRTCPGNDKDSAGTRQGNPSSSHVSAQLSLPLPLATGSRRRPCEKRPGKDGSDDEDNGREKRQRVRETTPDSEKIKVRCPYKVRHPTEFERCNVFTTWPRLVEHIVTRAHKPKHRCQKCGDIFDDQDIWAEHTPVCSQRSTRVFEAPICVGRDKVERVKSLTKRGRRSPPIDELYRMLWPILFENEDAPDRALWLVIPQVNGLQNRHSVRPAPPAEEQVPCNPGGQLKNWSSDGAPWNTGNLSPPGSLDALQNFSVSHEHASGCIDPSLLRATDTQVAHLQAPLLNDSSAVPTYPNPTALPSISTETNASEATVLACSSAQTPRRCEFLNDGWIPNDFDNLGGGAVWYENDLNNGEVPDDYSDFGAETT